MCYAAMMRRKRHTCSGGGSEQRTDELADGLSGELIGGVVGAGLVLSTRATQHVTLATLSKILRQVFQFVSQS